MGYRQRGRFTRSNTRPLPPWAAGQSSSTQRETSSVVTAGYESGFTNHVFFSVSLTYLLLTWNCAHRQARKYPWPGHQYKPSSSKGCLATLHWASAELFRQDRSRCRKRTTWYKQTRSNSSSGIQADGRQIRNLDINTGEWLHRASLLLMYICKLKCKAEYPATGYETILGKVGWYSEQPGLLEGSLQGDWN